MKEKKNAQETSQPETEITAEEQEKIDKLEEHTTFYKSNNDKTFTDKLIDKTDVPIGEKITSPGGITLIIKQKIEDGHTGIVYETEDENTRKRYALKVVICHEFKYIHSLMREQRKNLHLKDLLLLYAEIVEHGRDYCIKEWADGIRGDEWFENWVKQGHNIKDEAFVRLMKLYSYIALNGVYLQNLKAMNLIWNGKNWIIVDVGGKKTPESEASLARFHRTFNIHWNNADKPEPKCPTINELIGDKMKDYKVKKDESPYKTKKKEKKSSKKSGKSSNKNK